MLLFWFVYDLESWGTVEQQNFFFLSLKKKMKNEMSQNSFYIFFGRKYYNNWFYNQNNENLFAGLSGFPNQRFPLRHNLYSHHQSPINQSQIVRRFRRKSRSWTIVYSNHVDEIILSHHPNLPCLDKNKNSDQD